MWHDLIGVLLKVILVIKRAVSTNSNVPSVMASVHV